MILYLFYVEVCRMKHIQNFVEGLVDEGLNEAASTFFGKRKRLEDEILLFEKKCAQLHVVGEEVIAWGHALGVLLIDGDRLADFYTAIGVDLGEARQLMGSCWHVDFIFPSALFLKTKYCKTVYGLYRQLYTSCDSYRYGRYYDDPSRPGGKKQTVNYASMHDWLERLNAKIDGINNDNQASLVLQFAKQFRLGQNEKERIIGSDLHYTLDEDLAFPHIDSNICNFFMFPELPAPQSVRQAIMSLSGQVYAAHKEEIVKIMHEVKK
jgi:hypothetical protein